MLTGYLCQSANKIIKNITSRKYEASRKKAKKEEKSFVRFLSTHFPDNKFSIFFPNIYVWKIKINGICRRYVNIDLDETWRKGRKCLIRNFPFYGYLLRGKIEFSFRSEALFLC